MPRHIKSFQDSLVTLVISIGIKGICVHSMFISGSDNLKYVYMSVALVAVRMALSVTLGCCKLPVAGRSFTHWWGGRGKRKTSNPKDFAE